MSIFHENGDTNTVEAVEKLIHIFLVPINKVGGAAGEVSIKKKIEISSPIGAWIRVVIG